MDCFWLLSLVPTMLHHIVQQRHMGNVHSFTRMEGTIYKICLSAWGEPPKIYNICMYYQLLSLWTVSSSTKLYELYFPMDSEQQCTTRLLPPFQNRWLNFILTLVQSWVIYFGTEGVCAKRVAISTESTYQYHIATLVCTIACDFFFPFLDLFTRSFVFLAPLSW